MSVKTIDNKGFTLLEILLAVSILAVVSAMVGYAIKASVTTLEATRHRKDVYRQARVALDRIHDDLAGVVPESRFVGSSSQINGKSSGSLLFESTAHIDFTPGNPQAGAGEISYEVVPDVDNPAALKLIRTDVLSRPQAEGSEGTAVGFTLCEDLVGVSFTFRGQGGQKTDNWESGTEDEADSDKILPVMVYVSLEFLLDPDRLTTIVFDSAAWLPSAVIKSREEENGS